MLIISLLLTVLAGAQAASSTGRVTGRIVDAATGDPIPGVTVSMRPVLPSAGRSTPPAAPTPPDSALLWSLTSQTNVDGMFEVGGLPPGRWRLQIQKDGYIPLSATASSLTVDVGVGTVRVPDVRLDRGGAIVGRVLDARGNALVRMGVTAMQQVRNPDGTVRWGGGASASTNDLGEFRISGLAPGQYAVVAQPPPNLNPFIGGSPTAAATAHVPTVYPGSADIAQASPVIVSRGVTTTGIEFAMVSAPSYQVFGIVVDAAGRPVGGAAVRLVQARPPLAATVHQASPSALDGTFVIVNVPEGRYSAQAVIPRVVQTPGGGTSASVSFGPADAPGSVAIVVRGANVEGVRLVATPP